jgi:CarD family transcriptional regulator
METGISIGGSPVSVGERVVYPNGGICRVRGLEQKHIAGRDWRMLVLEREEDRARVMVPEEKVGTIGLRKVASAEDIRLLFDFFVSSSVDPELDWKIRHKENVGRLVAGGLLDTAQVLKGLHALSRLRPLPQREREMYDSARHQLVREIAAALSVPPAVAENNIDYALTPPPGSGRTAPKDAPIDLKALRKVLGGRKISVGGAELDLEEDGDEAGSDGEEGGDLFGDLGAGEAEGEGIEETAVAGNEDTEEPAARAPVSSARAAPSKAKKVPATAKPATAKPVVKPAESAAKKASKPKPKPASKPAEEAVKKPPAAKGEKKAPAKAPAKAKPASKTATAPKKPAVPKAAATTKKPAAEAGAAKGKKR